MMGPSIGAEERGWVFVCVGVGVGVDVGVVGWVGGYSYKVE